MRRLGIAGVTLVLAVLLPTVAGASTPLRARWTIEPTPNPAGANYSAFASIACVSQSDCTAVGFYNDTSKEHTFAEHWDGSGWSMEKTRDRPNTFGNSLAGVACPSANECVAVGASDKLTLVERWDGRRWTIVKVPEPPHSRAAGLTGVDCPTATSCAATGYFASTEGVGRPYSETWDGTAWSVQAMPVPAGAGDTYVFGMTCAGASDCTAVGGSDDQRITRHPLVEHWDGSAWSLVPAPDPLDRHFRGASLYDVSCSVPTDCVGVGFVYIGNQFARALVERWDGQTWSLVKAPDPESSSLDGVGCPIETACMAVGGGDPHPKSGNNFAERWNGVEWTVQRPPAPDGTSDASLSAIACSSPTICMAVGGAFGSSGGVNLAEQYAG